MNRHSLRYLSSFVFSVSMLITSPVQALDREDISFAGFATMSYGKAIDNDGDLGGFTDEGEYRNFNVLGLRMDAEMHDRVSFTVQMTADGVYNYEPDFQWIYANINLMQYLDARVGKQRVPLFVYSDFLDVGYAYPWISPPVAVYGDGSIRAFEGLSLIYSRPMGPVDSTLQLYGGRNEETIKTESGDEFSIDGRESMGFAWTVGYEWLQARASYYESTSTLSVNNAAFSQSTALLGAAETIMGADFMDNLLWEEDNVYFAGLGLTMDFNEFFFIAEKTQIRKGDASLILGDMDSWYLTAGIRPVDHWTFALTFSADRNDYHQDALKEYMAAYANFLVNTGGGLGNNFDLFGLGMLDSLTDAQELGFGANVVPLAGVIPGVGSIMTLANASGHANDDTYMLNARWDFHPKAAAKFEYLYKQARASDVERAFLGLKKSDSDAVRIAVDVVF